MGEAPGWSVGDQVNVLVGVEDMEEIVVLPSQVIFVNEEEEMIAVKVPHLNVRRYGYWFNMTDVFNHDLGLNPGDVFLRDNVAVYEEE